jgi:hypothetical protein
VKLLRFLHKAGRKTTNRKASRKLEKIFARLPAL